MTKTHNPLLSLGAHGTIADMVTFQESRQSTIARKKPTPSYRRTLLQQYQRWDYQDAYYYWQTLTSSQKNAYRAIASRRHIPIYAAFMRDYLTNLPDLLGRWHLDRVTTPSTPDSSRNSNPGTIFGVSPTPAVISWGYLADGLDDYIDFGSSPLFNFTSQAFTLELRYRPTTFPNYRRLVSRGLWQTDGWELWNIDETDRITFFTYQADAYQVTRTNVIAPGTFYHIAVKRLGSSIRLFLNGIDATLIAGVHLDPLSSSRNLVLCASSAHDGNTPAAVDELLFYNRALSDAQILNHSQRKYPN